MAETKFESVLNYTTQCGLKFELLEGETLVMNGFDLNSNTLRGTGCRYMVFFTNKRIILKQTNWQPRHAKIFTASIRTLGWDEVEFIRYENKGISNYITIKGTFKDFSKKETTDGNSEGGGIHPGGMGYANKEDMGKGVTTILSTLAKEYNFPLLCKGINEHLSTTSSQSVKEMDDNNPLANFGMMLGGMAILGALLIGGTTAVEAVFNLNKGEEVVAVAPPVETEIEYLDPATIVQPVVDPTGEYDYVIPSNTTYTCFTTEYPGYKPGMGSMEVKCDIPTGIIFTGHWDPYTSLDVEWLNTGTKATYNLLGSGDRGKAQIIVNGYIVDEGKWEVVTHNNTEYYYITTSTNDYLWFPVSSTNTF